MYGVMIKPGPMVTITEPTLATYEGQVIVAETEDGHDAALARYGDVGPVPDDETRPLITVEEWLAACAAEA